MRQLGTKQPLPRLRSVSGYRLVRQLPKPLRLRPNRQRVRWLRLERGARQRPSQNARSCEWCFLLNL